MWRYGNGYAPGVWGYGYATRMWGYGNRHMPYPGAWRYGNYYTGRRCAVIGSTSWLISIAVVMAVAGVPICMSARMMLAVMLVVLVVFVTGLCIGLCNAETEKHGHPQQYHYYPFHNIQF